MAEKKRSPELDAVEAVHSALKGLDPADRAKVLAAVSALLDMPVAEKSAVPHGQVPESTIRPQPPTSRPVSLIELVQDKQPSTNAQFITLFAYYREKYENQPRFARSDLEGYFAKARQTPPSNFDRDFADTVRKGWMHEEGADSYITSRGVEAVEGGFPGERRRAERSQPRKTKEKGHKNRRV